MAHADALCKQVASSYASRFAVIVISNARRREGSSRRGVMAGALICDTAPVKTSWMPFLILAACSGHNDRAATPSGASATPQQVPAPTAAPADATVDAPLWPPGEKPVERSAANDSPKMCMDPSTCTSLCEQ